MPGAADGIVDDESVNQGGVIMRTLCPDCENVVTAAYQENLFVVCVTHQHLAICEFANGKALQKIGTAQFGLFLGQYHFPFRLKEKTLYPALFSHNTRQVTWVCD